MSALAQEVTLKSQEPLVFAQRFGLSRDPFHDNGVEGLFYPGAGRRECLERLHHLSRYGHFLVHVVAAQGAGKSHLARMFYLQAQENNCRLSFIDTPVMMGPEQMVRMLAKGVGVALEENDSVARILEKLFSLAKQLKPQLTELVSIIDDAHQLAEDSLALLLDIAERAKEQGLGLHIVLLAEPQFNKLLCQPQRKALFEQCSYSMELEPFSEKDTRQYIEYRLRTAGYSQAFPFSDKLLRQLFQQSKGLPLRINLLASQLLAQQTVQSNKRSWGLPPVHLASVVVLGALLVALLFWNQEGRSPKVGASEAQVAHEKEEANRVFLSKEKLLVAAQKAKAPQSQALDAPVEESIKPPLATVAELRKLANPESVEPKAQAESAEEVFGGVSTPAQTIGDNAGKSGVQTFAMQPQTELQSRRKVTATGERTFANQKQITTKKAASSSAPAIVGPGLEKSSRWLRSRDPEHFTLQLLGAHNYDAVKSFIENSHAEDEIAQFSTLRQGQQWYVVVYGDYPSRDAAVLAVSKIPEKFRVLKPWVRSFASVQNDLERRAGN